MLTRSPTDRSSGDPDPQVTKLSVAKPPDVAALLGQRQRLSGEQP